MKVIFLTIAALAIFGGVGQGQQQLAPTPAPAKNYRAEYVLIRLEHIEMEIDRLLAAVDKEQETIDGFDLTIAEQTASLQKESSTTCTPEVSETDEESGTDKMETQAEANERCRASIDEARSNIGYNTVKRDVHERRRQALLNRLNAAYALRDKFEREIAGTPYEAH